MSVTSSNESEQDERDNDRKYQADGHVGGTLLRRSPRFDDENIERIHEDLGISEILNDQPQAEGKKQDRRHHQLLSPPMPNPLVDETLAPSKSFSLKRRGEQDQDDDYVTPRQVLLRHPNRNYANLPISNSGEVTSEISPMTAQIINEFCGTSRLELSVKRGEVFNVFGASEDFVGVEDQKAGKKGWIPNWCCNVFGVYSD